MAAPTFDTDLDDVFDLVADDTRLEILRALWTQRTDDGATDPDPVSFSELRKAVGVEDSGRFNYHLDKLTPYFVQDAADGYALTYAGARVIGAAVSGIYTDTETELHDTPMGPCGTADCDGTVTAHYEGGTVVIECDTCEVGSRVSAPPILVGAHDLEDDPRAVARFALTIIQKTVRGFCHVCNGPVEPRLDEDAPDPAGEGGVSVTFECDACGSASHTTAVSLLLDHPGVIAMLHDAGVDYRYALMWGDSGSFEWEETLRDDGSIEIRFDVPDDGATPTVILDEDFEVREYGRE